MRDLVYVAAVRDQMLQTFHCYAAALVGVLADPAHRARYGAAGRARFMKEFTSAAMVEATLAAYGGGPALAQQS